MNTEMTEQQQNVLQKELLQKYGAFDGCYCEDRLHMDGYKAASGPEVSIMPDKKGNLYLVFGFDPLSPFGSFLGRWCVPFQISPEFHFDKTHLWVQQVENRLIRIELRFPAQRQFADQDDQTIELVYGVTVKEEDTYALRSRKA